MSEEKRPSGVAVAPWGLALYGGARAIQIFLDAQPMASSVGQAILAEYGSSRLGVAWSDPDAKHTTTTVLRRAAIGAAIGIALALLVFVTPLATHALMTESVARVEVSVLGVGLVTALLQAWRDELLLHGIVLRAVQDTSLSAVGRVLACGATSAGAALGRSDANPRTVFVAFLLGTVFGALWLEDRGAWKACAAHAGLRWTVSTLLAGGFVQVRLADSTWAGGSAGLLAGTAAAVALAPAGVLAVVWAARRGISPTPARLG